MIKKQIELIPLKDFPLVQPNDELSDLILSTIQKNEVDLLEGDIVVIAHSIVSISERKLYHLEEVKVSQRAKEIGLRTEHSSERVEVALQEADEVIKEEPVLITRTKQGIITDFSGVDESNAPKGTMLALPDDPDNSARRISEALSQTMGFNIPVIISDTQGRPWRRGAVNLAIGVAGMFPFTHNVGKQDLYGHELRGSLVCLADQVAASTELVMGQADEGLPVIIVRGVCFDAGEGAASDILRSSSEDLFT